MFIYRWKKEKRGRAVVSCCHFRCSLENCRHNLLLLYVVSRQQSGQGRRFESRLMSPYTAPGPWLHPLLSAFTRSDTSADGVYFCSSITLCFGSSPHISSGLKAPNRSDRLLTTFKGTWQHTTSLWGLEPTTRAEGSHLTPLSPQRDSVQ